MEIINIAELHKFGNLVVFDIGGNNYRLVAAISYSEQRVWVLEVMTHAKYDRWQP